MTRPWDDPRVRRGMEAQLRLRRARLAAGDEPLGWKLGLGAPAAMEKLGLKAPLVGFLLRSALVDSGATVSVAGWAKPVAEPEIAIHIGRDVPAGADEAAVRAAIAALAPAIELADLSFAPEDPERVLAANIYQRRVVLGPRDETRAGARLDGITARIFRGGAEFAQTSDLEANTGKLVALVRHVTDTLAAFGERLRAGEIIIPGAVVPPIPLDPAGDGIAFRLDPGGEVSVRVAAGTGT